MLTDVELDILKDIINEEIKEYWDSGYEIDDDYIMILRNILRKLGIKEIYKYDKWKR